MADIRQTSGRHPALYQPTNMQILNIKPAFLAQVTKYNTKPENNIIL